MPMIASAATAGNRNQNAGERGMKRKRARRGARAAPLAGGTVEFSMNRLRKLACVSERGIAHAASLAAVLLQQGLLAVVITRFLQDFFRLGADGLRTVLDRNLPEHDLAAPLSDHLGHRRPFRETRPIVGHAALPRLHHRFDER